MKFLNEGRVHVKMWLDDVEDSALKQINNLADLPFAFHHVAIMPDCHSGYGMPIGGVLATKGVVLPNAVGVDIGCGMCAVKTSLRAEQLDKETLKKIMGKIREVIPVGKDHQKEKQDDSLMPKGECDWVWDYPGIYPVVSREYQSVLHQLGTLGGGNHFIEVQKDQEGFVWIMIHSGSRNLGKKVADHYNKIAKDLNERWYSQIPQEWDLAFLPIETTEAKGYMREMRYCVDFALANRKLMLQKIIHCFETGITDKAIFEDKSDYCYGGAEDLELMINIAHNYAAWEHHFKEDVIVHRKGATLAREGTVGIIPGSQGSKSYIVWGKGNPDSFMSCSHGAGRKMSRSKACATLVLQEEIEKLDSQGIVHGIRHQQDLDEASGAYKNIDDVMENQKDLVEIVTELQPLAVIKG